MELLAQERAEQLMSKENVSRRRLRQMQVREQSNEWMDRNRQKYLLEKERQVKLITESLTHDAQEKAVREIEIMERMHDLCAAQVGAAHRAAADLPDFEFLKAQKDRENSQKAKSRGAEALAQERAEAEKAFKTVQKLRAMRENLRREEDDRLKEYASRARFLTKSAHTVDRIVDKLLSKKSQNKTGSNYQPSIGRMLRVPKESVSEAKASKPQRLGRPSRKTKDVTYYDVSVPQGTLKYPAPPGLVQKHTKPPEVNAFEAAKRFSSIQKEMENKKTEAKLLKDRLADERGRKALKVAKLQRQLDDIQNEFLESGFRVDPKLNDSFLGLSDSDNNEEDRNELATAHEWVQTSPNFPRPVTPPLSRNFRTSSKKLSETSSTVPKKITKDQAISARRTPPSEADGLASIDPSVSSIVQSKQTWDIGSKLGTAGASSRTPPGSPKMSPKLPRGTSAKLVAFDVTKSTRSLASSRRELKSSEGARKVKESDLENFSAYVSNIGNAVSASTSVKSRMSGSRPLPSDLPASTSSVEQASQTPAYGRAVLGERMDEASDNRLFPESGGTSDNVIHTERATSGREELTEWLQNNLGRIMAESSEENRSFAERVKHGLEISVDGGSDHAKKLKQNGHTSLSNGQGRSSSAKGIVPPYQMSQQITYMPEIIPKADSSSDSQRPMLISTKKSVLRRREQEEAMLAASLQENATDGNVNKAMTPTDRYSKGTLKATAQSAVASGKKTSGGDSSSSLHTLSSIGSREDLSEKQVTDYRSPPDTTRSFPVTSTPAQEDEEIDLIMTSSSTVGTRAPPYTPRTAVRRKKALQYYINKLLEMRPESTARLETTSSVNLKSSYIEIPTSAVSSIVASTTASESSSLSELEIMNNGTGNTNVTKGSRANFGTMNGTGGTSEYLTTLSSVTEEDEDDEFVLCDTCGPVTPDCSDCNGSTVRDASSGETVAKVTVSVSPMSSR